MEFYLDNLHNKGLTLILIRKQHKKKAHKKIHPNFAPFKNGVNRKNSLFHILMESALLLSRFKVLGPADNLFLAVQEALAAGSDADDWLTHSMYELYILHAPLCENLLS